MSYGIPDNYTDASPRSGQLAPAVNGLSNAVDDLDERLTAVKTTADSALSKANTAKSKNDSQDSKIETLENKVEALEDGSGLVVGVPGGGSVNQVLTKTGTGNGQIGWRTPTGGSGGGSSLPGGGETGEVLAKAGPDDGDVEWVRRFVLPASVASGQVLKSDAETQTAYWDVADGIPAGGSTNQVLAKNSGNDGDASWKDAGALSGGGATTAVLVAGGQNFWYGTPAGGSSTYMSNIPVGVVQAVPIRFARAVTIDRMSIYIYNPGTATQCRLGIYADNNGVPGLLVCDAGFVSTSVSGQQQVTLPNVQLPAGLYWLATLIGNNGGSGSLMAVMGSTQAMGGPNGYQASYVIGWRTSTATPYLPTNPLPAPFPDMTANVSPQPYVAVRAN